MSPERHPNGINFKKPKIPQQGGKSRGVRFLVGWVCVIMALVPNYAQMQTIRKIAATKNQRCRKYAGCHKLNVPMPALSHAGGKFDIMIVC